mmetsp:Transcript_24894/g.80539  ORF Transcript_24894/g.80539 Transcript_24894/m.80539 type:complete len:257 (-) Transcript_24894:1251-2021(-)
MGGGGCWGFTRNGSLLDDDDEVVDGSGDAGGVGFLEEGVVEARELPYGVVGAVFGVEGLGFGELLRLQGPQVQDGSPHDAVGLPGVAAFRSEFRDCHSVEEFHVALPQVEEAVPLPALHVGRHVVEHGPHPSLPLVPRARQDLGSERVRVEGLRRPCRGPEAAAGEFNRLDLPALPLLQAEAALCAGLEISSSRPRRRIGHFEVAEDQGDNLVPVALELQGHLVRDERPEGVAEDPVLPPRLALLDSRDVVRRQLL